MTCTRTAVRITQASPAEDSMYISSASIIAVIIGGLIAEVLIHVLA